MSDLTQRLRRTLSDFPGNDDELFNEIHEQREAAANHIEALEKQLELYRDAVRVDMLMSGPRFSGSNVSALKRAWEADRATFMKGE